LLVELPEVTVVVAIRGRFIMELIVSELSEFTRRSRSLVVAHGATDLTRGLEYGERILVRSNGEYRTAVVVDIDFDLTDTNYRLVLGGRVPAELAEETLIGEIDPSANPAEQVSVRDIADMLARSGSAHRIPMQRQVVRRLLER
jgi:hypothetical protein